MSITRGLNGDQLVLRDMKTALIHSFERPPVIETVLGVQFKPLPKLGNAQLGLFLCSLQGDWGRTEDVPLLPLQHERFDGEQLWSPGDIKLEFTQSAASRIKMYNKNEDRMIQIQNGRFHYNWIRKNGSEYPRYQTVKPEFEELFRKFNEFIIWNSLGNIESDQWEITYINHLPRQTVWDKMEDVASVFKSIPATIAGKSLKMENVSHSLTFEIEPNIGRLHVRIHHGMSKLKDKSSQEVIRFELTARGPIKEEMSLDKGLDKGRQHIVETFFNLTSSEAHKYWGYTGG